jgi:hypothetical protein
MLPFTSLPVITVMLPRAVALCLVSPWQYQQESLVLSLSVSFQYGFVEFHMPPALSLSLWFIGDGILGGVGLTLTADSFWWQVVQFTADVLAP